MASREFPRFYGNGPAPVWTLTGLFKVLSGWICLVVSIDLLGRVGWPGIVGIAVGVYLLYAGFRTDDKGPTPQRAWLEAACKAIVPILKRQYQEEDDTGAYFMHPNLYNGPTPEAWYLHLGMLPCQAALAPNEKQVRVTINEHQYHHYAGKTDVTIYYSPEDPFAFLLEDEMQEYFGSRSL